MVCVHSMISFASMQTDRQMVDVSLLLMVKWCLLSVAQCCWVQSLYLFLCISFGVVLCVLETFFKANAS